MEKVYNPRKLTYVSPPVDLKKFLAKSSEAENSLFSFFFNTPRADKPIDGRHMHEAFKNFADRCGLAEPVSGSISEVEYVCFLLFSFMLIAFDFSTSLEKIIHEFPVVDYDPAYPPLDSKLQSHK